MKKETKHSIAVRKIVAITVVAAVIFSIPCLYNVITGYQKQQVYCHSNVKYADVHIRAILEGKFDDGTVQKNKGGEYVLDISSSPYFSEIEYKNKTVKCFLLCDNSFDGYTVTVGDIRGEYLNDEALKNTPVYSLFPNNKIPVCPFSTDDNVHYYCVLENGAVVCSHPRCQ